MYDVIWYLNRFQCCVVKYYLFIYNYICSEIVTVALYLYSSRISV